MKNILLCSFLLQLILFGNKCKGQFPLLDSMTAQIENKSYTGIDAILILRNTELIYEHYFNGYSRDSLHDSRSSFKSITSLLVGIAIDKGFIKDVHQKVYSFFPEHSLTNQDDWKKEMTIKNLLEMESGFDCDEWNESKDCEGPMGGTLDWVRFSLDLPMKNKPGTVWAYTSCNPMILSGIISKASHMSVMDFGRKYLFDPMGIVQYQWTVDSSGHGMTGGSFLIRPQDMIKIGQMVRDNGIWNGKRIVSERWLQDATFPAIRIPDYSYVKISKTQLAFPQPTYYGYYWYSETIKTKNYEGNMILASGNGGQYIMILKNLHLVVVFMQSNYNSWKAKRSFDMLVRFILPGFE